MNEDDMADALEEALDNVESVRNPTNSVVSATSEDTVRATRSMREQMENIVANLERDIKEADDIRLRVVRRIDDLKRARLACMASLESLNGGPLV